MEGKFNDATGDFEGKKTWPNGKIREGKFDGKKGVWKRPYKENFSWPVLQQGLHALRRFGVKDVSIWDDEQYDKRDISAHFYDIESAIKKVQKAIEGNQNHQNILKSIPIKLNNSSSAWERAVRSEGYNESQNVITIDYHETPDEMKDDILKGIEDRIKHLQKNYAK